MNEFLQQFLIESRELVEHATEALLILEQSPLDTERLDAAFRDLHTLKGGAGIVEFAAMERAVHAAEDVLSRARSNSSPLTPALVADCLVCLDQVLQWLDSLEQTGELPPASSDGEADRIIARFRVADADIPKARSSPVQGSVPGWIADILGRNSNVRAQAKTAVRFIPDSDCFYKGEDPIARVTALQGLLVLDLAPLNEWPALEAFDPFTCNLVLTALTASTISEVSAQMEGHTGECEIRTINSDRDDNTSASLPPHARDVLSAQIAFLTDSKARSLAGRIGSAGVTAANVLRYSGRNGDAEILVRAMQESLAATTADTLLRAIAQTLAPEFQAPAIAVPVSHRTEVTARTLRIDAERIDALVRLTGELTVAKNAIEHVVKMAQTNDTSIAGVLKDRHAVLDRLIGELQSSVLAMRVLPLRSVFQRFPRVVREMSASLGKPVRLAIEGEDTEADKAIVEMLFEPLLHIVRNAVDHGVESPQQRTERGKPPVGTIRMRAERRRDQVLIEVNDDGRGIDLDRVREVAKERGVTNDESLRSMTDAEVIDLVFAPGFSTSATVTELSGRGVGMDAVRTAVERVGGRAAIESRAGHGTTVSFSLPFSVMMTHVMTVEAGGQLFGVPLDAVVETVRVPREAIAAVGAAHAIVLRNRTVPVLQLANVLGVREETRNVADALIVVTTVAGQLYGIHVDRLGERMAVILKPLEGLLADTPGITGTTLMGDGRVLLVLDIGELLQ